MINNPIFIIGTERSGSNLLRLILNAHPHIAIPHPPHIMRDFAPLLPGYGNLSETTNFQQLSDDVIHIVENHFSPWPFKVTSKMIREKTPSLSLYGIYVALYESFMENEGKARWGCKSTFMFSEIKTILEHHSGPRFIHLVRDPRDIAVSASQSIFSKYHPYKMAELWKYEQEEIEKWSYLKDEGKLLTIYYEDLTRDPSHVMQTVMTFLEEEFYPEQLNFFKEKEASLLANLSQSWKQVESPISTRSVGQFSKRMSRNDIEMIEYLCHHLMQKYNYQLVNEVQNLHQPNFLKSFQIEYLESFIKWKTEFRSMFSDRNFYLRWKKKFLLQKIKLLHLQ